LAIFIILESKDKFNRICSRFDVNENAINIPNLSSLSPCCCHRVALCSFKFKAISFLLKAANDGHKRAHRELGMIYLYNLDDEQVGNAQDGVMWMDLAAKEGFIDCYFRLGEMYAAGNNKYDGIPQNQKAAKKYLEMARDESNLSSNPRHKLPENIWNLMLNNPLQAVTLLENYEKAIGAKWRGQYLADLNPETYNKMQ